MKIHLKGIAWAHTRALAPLQVTSQVYRDFHPDVIITWDIRSLHHFGEGALEELTSSYDLLLIDHPFMGAVADSGLFLPLDEVVAADVLKRLSQQSLGQSYNSYNYNGHQWALPIDGAAQIAASRTDFLEQAGYDIPQTWNAVMQLAKETRKVAMPMAAMGLLGAFFTLCANKGHAPFSNENRVVDDAVAEEALSQLVALYELMPSWCLDVYPPYIFNKMATSEEIWYVPISYGYVNYSLKGYAPHLLTAHNIPASGAHGCKGATLGGVGIAISASCKQIETAIDYATWITGADCQKTLYSYSGGQSADIEAWKSDELNALTNNFYSNTIATLEGAFVRPRYNGYHHFQSFAGKTVQSVMRKEMTIKEALKKMNEAYSKSREGIPKNAVDGVRLGVN